MKNERRQSKTFSPSGQENLQESGFALSEFLISTVLILSLSAGIFTMLTDVQSTSGYQTEVLNAMDNSRIAMGTLERFILQAGSNPTTAALTPVTITDDKKVRLCADLTGASGTGDPDGFITGPNEDVTIQYNRTAKTIEIVTPGAGTQTLARYITNFSMQYFDKDGIATTVGADVRMIRVTVTGSSTLANPKTGRIYGQTVTSDFTLQNRA
jgi:hypothetical protein